MEALVLKANALFALEDRPIPVPAPGEALIKVAACGVCGSDIGRTMKNGAYHYPLVAGHEFAGHVAALGEGVQGMAVGDPVAVFPMLPCMTCPNCKAGRYNLCSHYDYFGSRRDGGFEEYVSVPQWNLLTVPKDLSMEVAAMCEPVAVALHALKRGSIRPGDTVGIAGAGPIGLVLSKLALLFGADSVIIWDIDPEKVTFSKQMGNELTLDAKKVNVPEEIEHLRGQGLDLVIEGTGASAGLAACVSAAKHRGRIVTMGNPGGDMTLPKDNYSQILRKELTLSGTWNSDRLSGIRDDWQTVIRLLSENQVWFRQLISHRFRLKDKGKPLEMMTARNEFFCKVMYIMGEAT